MKKFKKMLKGATVILVFLLSCTSAKNWKGNDVPGSNTASFKDYNGKSNFKVLLDQPGPFYVKYQFEQEKGELSFTIKSGSGTVLDKKIIEKGADSLVINNPRGEQYLFVIEGKNATGNFNIKYDNLHEGK